jgi:hypothetical protein
MHRVAHEDVLSKQEADYAEGPERETPACLAGVLG